MQTTSLSAKRLKDLSYTLYKRYKSDCECSQAVKQLESKGYTVRIIVATEGILRYRVYYVYIRKNKKKAI